jgi:ribosome-associated heat shock protein Hsp15
MPPRLGCLSFRANHRYMLLHFQLFLNTHMRLDQWLWAIRLYKTRNLAVAAIKNSQVKISAAVVKPARDVRVGEILTVQQGVVTRTVRVLGVPPSRVGAKLVPQFAEDLTPPEEFEKARDPSFRAPRRPPGAGRPTKLERRMLEAFLDLSKKL